MGMILTSLFLSDSMVNGEMCISNRSGEVSGAQLTFKSATSISHDSNLQKIRLTMGYGKVKQQQKLAIERDDALRFNSITPVEHNLEYFPYPSEIDRFLLSGLTKSKLSKGSCGSKRSFVGAGLGPEVGEVPKSYDYKEPPSSIKRCAELGIPKLSLAESSSHLSPISDRSDSSFRLSSCSKVSSNRLGYFSPASSIASEDSSPLRESESSSKFKKLKVK